MADNIHTNLFDQNGELTAAALQRYVEGKLSQQEQQLVDQYLHENEFESEAAEGLQTWENTSALPNVMAELHQRVEKKIGGNEKKVVSFNFRKLAAAAAVVLVVAVAIWLLQGEKEQADQPVLAENLEKYPNVINVDSIILAIESFEKKEIATPSQDSKTAVPPKEIEISASVQNKMSYQWEVQEMDMSQGATTDDTLDGPESTKEESQFSSKAEIKRDADMMPAPETASNSIQIVRGKVLTAENLASALTAYEKNDFGRALKLFNQVLKEDPNNTTAIFYSGLSHFQNEEYKKALPYLTRMSQVHDSPFYEAAQWHRALSHIKLKNEKAARPILQEVAAGGGDYATQAKEMLAQMK